MNEGAESGGTRDSLVRKRPPLLRAWSAAGVWRLSMLLTLLVMLPLAVTAALVVCNYRYNKWLSFRWEFGGEIRVTKTGYFGSFIFCEDKEEASDNVSPDDSPVDSPRVERYVLQWRYGKLHLVLSFGMVSRRI